MINLLDRQVLHKLAILELAVRSLQYDYVQLETLKMHKLYTTWTELLLKHLYPAYTMQKRRKRQIEPTCFLKGAIWRLPFKAFCSRLGIDSMSVISAISNKELFPSPKLPP